MALEELAAQEDWAALVPVLRRIMLDPDDTDLTGLDPIDTALAAELHRAIVGDN